MRAFELCLVVAIAITPLLVRSFLVYFGKSEVIDQSLHGSSRYAYLVWQELVWLALLIYILARSGRSFHSIGRRPELADIWRTLPLAACAWGASRIAAYSMFYGYWFATRHLLDLQPKHLEFAGSTSGVALLITILVVLVNPVFEEMTVRAYLQTELTFLMRSRWLPAIISVVVQSAYHLYQGVPSAISIAACFAVFAVYFARTGRAAPLILAHVCLDATAIYHYARV